MISNLNIRHTYLNTEINNQRKTYMPDHWPLRATKVATSILKIQTSTFLPKMMLLESGDHCDLKFKYKPHLSKYKNKYSGKNPACLITDHWEQQR